MEYIAGVALRAPRGALPPVEPLRLALLGQAAWVYHLGGIVGQLDTFCMITFRCPLELYIYTVVFGLKYVLGCTSKGFA